MKRDLKNKRGMSRLFIIGVIAIALLFGIMLISALTTDFGELNSNIYIGDSYLFNSPSSPNPLQTPSFRMEYKSEGFGEEQNALVSELDNLTQQVNDAGYNWLVNYSVDYIIKIGLVK